MRKFVLTSLLSFLIFSSSAQIKKKALQFEFEGKLLHGVLNMPETGAPKGIILIVHGSGQTNAVEQEWYKDVRAQMVELGYATYMWDKRGCGKSEGVFDYNQPVANSAQEVIAAINTLKKKQIPGADAIGLWGVSRAGWINPLVINTYKDIKFWISVSGVDEKENFKYLLKENLRIEGLPQDSVDLLVSEWVKGGQISHAGGSFEAYQAATSNLRKNPFLRRFMNDEVSEESYYSYQKVFMKEEYEETSGLQIYIPDFEEQLSQIHIPVLALFGEKDRNVDWKKSKALYERTLGQHTDLTIQSFPNCNHNMYQCKTGGFYEMQDDKLPWDRCVGFLETMADWLEELE